MTKKTLVTGLAILFAISIFAQTTNTKDSKVNFKLRNVGLMVKGSFDLLDANIKIDESDLLKSNFNFKIKSTSLNTKNSERDNEWKDTTYFFTQKYPEISFISDTVRKSDNGYLISGKFKIKNRSVKIFIPVTTQKSKGNTVYKGEFVADRKDFDVATANLKLGNKITFVFEIVTK